MENKITIPIGQGEARSIADGIKYEISHNNDLKHIELKARGKNIAKAVDVLEILKRELRIKDIQIKALEKELNKYMPIKEKIDVLTIYKESVKQENIYRLAGAIYRQSKKYNVESDLIISIAYVESRFKKYARSYVGCDGYMGIYSDLHNVDKSRIYDAEYNVKWGCLIFVDKLNRFDDNEHMALNAYNGWASYSNSYANDVYKVKNKIKKVSKKCTI